jgi:hypothetical protein
MTIPKKNKKGNQIKSNQKAHEEYDQVQAKLSTLPRNKNLRGGNEGEETQRF